MRKVDVSMLGSFVVLADGVNIVDKLNNSKKSVELLQYFLLNKDKPVSMNELYDTLWPSDENTNPESTLRTRISRFRTELEKVGLENAVKTVSGFYKWNDAIETRVDVFELEALCEKLTKTSGEEEKEVLFEQILAMYNGDLLNDYAVTSWIVPRSMYYHNLFIDAMHEYTEMLEEKKRYADLSRVARRALESDRFDSALNLKLMNSLLKTGKSQEAFIRYNNTTGMHYSYLGVNPSVEILDFYKSLLKTEQDSAADIENVAAELEAQNDTSGALICEYAIFKDIYKIYYRNLKRLNTTMFLAMVSLSEIDSGQKSDPLMLEKAMGALLDSLNQSLRMGDAIARYSPSQYVLLLPTLSWQSGQTVLHRLKNKFYEVSPSNKFVLNFKLKPLEF